MKIVSLYSGADNLGDGFIQAGHEIILCVEKDFDCCQTINLNHPDIEVINNSVSEVLTTLPECDMVIGGPPCPEFSRAKSDRTFDLCEVNNFRKAIEITKAKHHFMENVQDLYQVHKERNFLVNCADYGVPQTRIRRIFTDLPLPQPTHAEFPSERLFGEPMKKWVSVREALNLDGIIEDRKTKYFDETEYRRYSVDKPHHTLITDSRDFFISNSGHSTQNRENITRSIDEPADTIVCASNMQITDYEIKSIKKIKNRVIQNREIFGWKKKNNIESIDKPSSTLMTDGSGNGRWLGDGEKFERKLTNEELAILQGFRTDFKFYGGKTSVRRQIGNALPAAISKAFAEQITLEAQLT